MTKRAYQRSMRSNFRGMWAGAYGFDQFVYFMTSTIRAGLREAFDAGMKRAGIPGFAITAEERVEMQVLINKEITHIAQAGIWLEGVTKAAGGKLNMVLYRADGWVARYSDANNLGYQLGLKDQPQIWEIGPSEEHCPDCSTYHGRVYRASTWHRYNIRPQNTNLNCFGIHCKCKLKKTNLPLWRGRPPAPTGKG